MNISISYVNFIHTASYYADANTYTAGEFGYVLNGLASEGGEVLDVHKKITRVTGHYNQEAYIGAYLDQDAPHLLDMLKELGDVMWYLTRMCQLLGIAFDDLRIINTLKLHERLGNVAWPLDNVTREDALSIQAATLRHIREILRGQL